MEQDYLLDFPPCGKKSPNDVYCWIRILNNFTVIEMEGNVCYITEINYCAQNIVQLNVVLK